MDYPALGMARREADREVAQGSGGFVVVFDEVQNIPQWSTVVKGLWDRDRFDDRPLHVVILGSAPMRVQSGLTESLVGEVREGAVRPLVVR